MKEITLFLKTWGVVLVLNQVLLYNATFSPYAIIAAIPHTFIISLVSSYIIIKRKKEKEEREKLS